MPVVNSSSGGSAAALRARRQAAALCCERWLFVRPFGSTTKLARIASVTSEDEQDFYGQGGAVQKLEDEVAALLGKPAAVFMPSGIMAQQAVLRVYADRAGSDRVAIHDLAHLLRHELDALQELHGLRFERLTSERRPPSADDLLAIPGRLAAATLELPLRDAGYLLPTWEELVAFAQVCRDRELPLHLDGARLWESVPYFEHSLDEIAGLATSVYVSFYKGLGGSGGAVVAGPESVVREVRRWQRRLGGNLFTLLPFAVTARHGLRTVMPLMDQLHRYAVDLGARLPEIGFRIFPPRPHINAFRVYAPHAAEELDRAAVTWMEGTRESISPTWLPADVPGWSWTEFTVTPDTLGWTLDEAMDRLGQLVAGLG